MSDPAGPPNIRAIFGPLLIGLGLSIGLQGILLAQWYVYWKKYRIRDSRRFRLLVFGLCALELFHCAMTAHAGYWYLIQNYNRPAELNKLVWSIIVELALTVLITFIGRAFWIVWLFRLSGGKRWLTGITSAFSFAQLALGIGMVYDGVRNPVFSTISDGKVAVISQMLSADLGDTIISIALCHYLHTSRSGIRKTDLLIHRLVLFTCTRGFFVIGSGALQLITYVAWPKTFIFGAFHLIASKLYTNALLATLNSRDDLVRPLNRPSVTADTELSFALGSLTNTAQSNMASEVNAQARPDSTVHLGPVIQDYRYHDTTQLIVTKSTSSSLPILDLKSRDSLTLMHDTKDEGPTPS